MAQNYHKISSEIRGTNSLVRTKDSNESLLALKIHSYLGDKKPSQYGVFLGISIKKLYQRYAFG